MVAGLQDKKFDVLEEGSGENPLEFKIPQKFLKFYVDVGKWIDSRNLTDKFVASIIRTDYNRDGFLKNCEFFEIF